MKDIRDGREELDYIDTKSILVLAKRKTWEFLPPDLERDLDGVLYHGLVTEDLYTWAVHPRTEHCHDVTV